MMRVSFILAALLAASSYSASAAPSSCALGSADEAWLNRSMAAWNYAAMKISGIGHVKKIEAVIFDDKCVVTSTTAMNGGPNRWQGRPHGGKIVLPDGTPLKPQVISFSGSTQDRSFFVMSTPSVWRSAGKTGKGASLETLMTAVMLHEGTHVAQMPTYGEAIQRISDRNHLPQDFSDDSIQQHFADNKDFTASVDRESRLLFDAWHAKTRRDAVALVRQARMAMKARYAKWFTGKDAYMADAEPVWLTLEGSGQWLAYTWEVDPHGGRVAPADILPGFENDRYWTQREGLAVFLALQRLTGSEWKKQAFHLGQMDILQMLDEAIRV
jgi:hypothetical protein